MKKIIAILVVFAMVTTVAFAETSINASIETRWTIAQGSTSGGSVTTVGEVYAATIGFTGANDEGTFGGRMQYVFNAVRGHNYDTTIGNAKLEIAYAWWEPIPQLRLFLGQDGDGMFNTAGLSRWGHHRMDRGIAVEDWDAGNYLIGNWDEFGMALIVKPIDGLAINLAFNIPGVNPSSFTPSSANAIELGDWFKGIQAQVSYALDGVGTFLVTYRGENHRQYNNRIGLTYQSAGFVDGLAFEVGGNYDLSSNVAAENALYFGAGVHYSLDNFGVRFRAMLHPSSVAFMYKVDVMPFYAFSFGTLFCNIRIANFHDHDDKYVGNGNIGFHINPYLRLAIGGGDFRFGVMFEDDDGNGTFGWKVPISMLISF